MVGRADIWRTRMDATTNWAIGSTAAVISFALGSAETPHYVVFIASLMTLAFLLLEARRLTFYHLWQQRALLLEDGFIRGALGGGAVSPETVESLEAGLGRTVPSMPLSKAVARRLRRVYLYLFGVQLIAWVVELSNHPSPAGSLAALVERAGIGAVPGAGVLAATLALFVAASVFAASRGGRG
jgi:uncharacterized membrane protein